MSTFAWRFWTWTCETQSLQLCYREPQRKKCGRKAWSFLQQLRVCSKSESSFWIQSKKYRRWRIPIFLLTRKQYPAGSFQTCMHQGRLGKAEKDFLNKTDVIKSCIPETMNTKLRFYKLTNCTVFAVFLNDVPMGCKDAVLPKPLPKNHTINYLTYEENTRQPYNDNLFLFRALSLHLHGNQPVKDETPKIFTLFLSRMDRLSPSQFQRVHMNDSPFVEGLLYSIFFPPFSIF